MRRLIVTISEDTPTTASIDYKVESDGSSSSIEDVISINLKEGMELLVEELTMDMTDEKFEQLTDEAVKYIEEGFGTNGN